MQAKPPQAEVVFSSDVKNMDDWAKRSRIPLKTVYALSGSYARSRRWMQSLKMNLIH